MNPAVLHRRRRSPVTTLGLGAVLLTLGLGVMAPSVASAQDPSATAVACTPTTQSGTAATCTVTVSDTAATGASTPTGTVSFSATPGTSTFTAPAACTLSADATSGLAACQVAFTPAAAGAYAIVATYGGDAGHTGSVGNGSVDAVDATSTAVSCGSGPDTVNDAVACTATVTDPNGGAPITGTVTFSATPSGGGTFDTPQECTFTTDTAATPATGSCPIQFVPTTPGTVTISAAYSGDEYHLTSSGSGTLTATATAASEAVPGAGSPSSASGSEGPGAPPTVGTLSIGKAGTVGTSEEAAIPLACAGGSGAQCSGSLTLTAAGAAHATTSSKTKNKKKKKKKKKGKTKTKRKPKRSGTELENASHAAGLHGAVAANSAPFGSVAYSVAAGDGTDAGVPLTPAALAALAAAPGQALAVTVTATQADGTIVTGKLTLKLTSAAGLKKTKKTKTSGKGGGRHGKH